MIPILAFVLLLAAIVAFAAFGMKYVFDYRITERGLYILLARLIPLKVLPLRKIVAVERGPFDRNFWRWGVFTSLRLGNRLRGEAVLVKTRGLPITGVIVTPADPDLFERDLRRLIEARDRT
jgi:hypothetical protein